MATELKIETSNPTLLVKYRDTVKAAMDKGVRDALAEHKAAGNPIAVSRDGKVVLIQLAEFDVHHSALDKIWGTDEDDVYAELLNR